MLASGRASSRRVWSIVGAVVLAVVVGAGLWYVEEGERNIPLFVLALAITGAIAGLGFWRALRRRSTLAQAASVLGFSFQISNEEWVNQLADFPLLKRKGSTSIGNLLKGVKEGKEVVLFDYTITEGDSVRRQTVAAFRLRKDRLPFFDLAPERFVQSLFGIGDIDFPSHPAFSNRYFLRSPDERATRALFQPRVFDVLAARKESWGVQGGGAYLLVFRPRVTVHPSVDGLKQFLNEAHAIFSAFGKN